MQNSLPDFDALRQTAFGLIRRLAPQTWTDHNTADPGLTLLEQLCYALTDLGYRMDFDIADLLEGEAQKAHELLFTPRKILTTKPVTFADYRQLLLDTRGIKNVVVHELKTPPKLELYYAPFSKELLLEKDKDELLPDEVYRPVLLKGLVEAILQKEKEAQSAELQQIATQQLHQNRSLCTDFDHIGMAAEEKIKIQLDIELGTVRNKEELLARIWQILEQYVSPSLQFHPLRSLLQSNHSITDVFEGPALAQGFFLPKEAAHFQKRIEIRRSDLIQDLMTLSPEIKAIRLLHIAKGDIEFENAPLDWVVALEEEKTNCFVFNRKASEITFYTNELTSFIDSSKAEEIYAQLKQKNQAKPLSHKDLDIQIPKGSNRQVGHYTSIRNHLPEVFGITPYGLPDTASTLRKAQAKQLSAYLLFFEQILADHFAQLAALPSLFSIDRTATDIRSYFTQALNELGAERMPAIGGVYDKSQLEKPEIREAFADQDDSHTNRLLDHFLARFAEQFSDNVLESEEMNENTFHHSILAKRTFLKEYPELSAARGGGYDRTQAAWNTENVAGTQKRIARLLGLRSFQAMNLADGKEGFYLLEHILLRPVQGDRFQEGALLGHLETADPYSLKVSYVFHKIGRFEKVEKQNFTHQLLRSETPAHIHLQVYWLTTDQVEEFESVYRTFLSELQQLKNETSSRENHHHQFAFRVARDRLIDVLNVLTVPRPVAAIQKNKPIGIPFPLRDLPIKVAGANAEQQKNGKWQAKIRIYYPQIGVTYRLCNRDREPIPGAKNLTIKQKVDVLVEEKTGRPFAVITTPSISQDTAFWIRAEKNTQTDSQKLRYVFLKEVARVKVGVALVKVTALLPEINYGTSATIRLSDIQANVNYQLYADLNGKGDLTAISDRESGLEDGTIELTTNKENPLTEDVSIVVKGSRETLLTNSDIDVGSVFVRVRANPAIAIQVEKEVIDFGSTTKISLVSIGENLTQTSVQYHLYYREISDPEFVHQKLEQIPDTEVVAVEIGKQPTVKILRPLLPNMLDNGPEDHISPPLTPIAYQSIGKTFAPRNKGARVEFDTSGLSLQEDTLFLVLATKEHHEKPIVLETNGRTSIGVVLTRPATSSTFSVAQNPVPKGEKGRILLSNTQAGVKYYLQFSNGQKQPFKFQHDELIESPRRDGVGFSKVGVDKVVGKIATPLVLETRKPMAQNRTLKLIAEKIQTGITTVVEKVTFKVSE